MAERTSSANLVKGTSSSGGRRSARSTISTNRGGGHAVSLALSLPLPLPMSLLLPVPTNASAYTAWSPCTNASKFSLYLLTSAPSIPGQFEAPPCQSGVQPANAFRAVSKRILGEKQASAFTCAHFSRTRSDRPVTSPWREARMPEAVRRGFSGSWTKMKGGG